MKPSWQICNQRISIIHVVTYDDLLQVENKIGFI